jgi:hypothetical protein
MRRILTSALCFLLPGLIAAAPPPPATAIFFGEIAGNIVLAPQEGDQVLVFSLVDGRPVGSAPVGRSGSYQLIVALAPSFADTPLIFELQQQRRRYALLDSDGRIAVVRFAGRLLPERSRLDWRLGRQTAELRAADAAGIQAQRLVRHAELPCDAQADINEDGRCDEADWALLQLYAGGITRTIGQP